MRASPLVVCDTPTKLPPLGEELAAASMTSTGLDTFCVPAAEELNIPSQSSSVILRGGEKEALRRLEAHLTRAEWIASFEKPMTSPTDMDAFGANTRSTTCLSPYLKFGCLSPR